MSEEVKTPEAIIKELQEKVSSFESIVKEFNTEKIKKADAELRAKIRKEVEDEIAAKKAKDEEEAKNKQTEENKEVPGKTPAAEPNPIAKKPVVGAAQTTTTVVEPARTLSVDETIAAIQKRRRGE